MQSAHPTLLCRMKCLLSWSSLMRCCRANTFLRDARVKGRFNHFVSSATPLRGLAAFDSVRARHSVFPRPMMLHLASAHIRKLTPHHAAQHFNGSASASALRFYDWTRASTSRVLPRICDAAAP
eukprot:4739454-Pyramimonas_sp.AAC.1